MNCSRCSGIKWSSLRTGWMRMAAALLLVTGLAGLAAGLVGCDGRAGGERATARVHRQVAAVATFYPMAYFTSQVGGDRVEVVTLVPNGVEPHEWEPGARQMVSLDQADVFIYNGAGLEPWAARMAEGVSDGGPVVVEATKGLELIPATGETTDGQQWDPHVWLDPVLAQGEVARIMDGLIAADPEGAPAYRANGEALISRLQALDNKYRQSLAGTAGSNIFTSHAAFSYLAQRYSLRQVPIAGPLAEVEPGSARMAALVRLAREDGARYIFYESLGDPRVAETLAAEVGAGTLELNPLEGLTSAEVARGEDYFTVMEQNLVNLLKVVKD